MSDRTSTSWIVAAAGLLLAVTVATGLYLGVQTRRQFTEIAASWEEYASGVDRKGALISALRGHLGYGGIIHTFKNYVLRREDIYRERTLEQLDEFDRVMEEYLALPLPDRERGALGVVAETIAEYRGNLAIAERAAREGWQAERTDRLVKVDDTAALAALRELEAIWREAREQSLERVIGAVVRGEGLIGVGFLSMALLVVASLALAFTFWALLRRLAGMLERLSEELTARQAAEVNVKRLAQAVEQSPATIVITDTGGRIQYVNRHFEQLSGWTREEVIGRTPSFLQSGDTDAEEYRQMRALLGQGRIWRGVFRNRKKDGGSYWVESAILPLRNPDGSADSYLGIGEDITERRQAREQIARAQKIEAVGLLAGGIAHDFNNILTSIVGAAHLASLDAPEGSDLAAEIEQIEIAAKRAQALVQQLLGFARRAPGKLVATDLRQAVREVIRLTRAATPRTIAIGGDAEAASVWVTADPVHLHQILMNLCNNAAEAIGGAKGAIRIAARPEAEGPEGLADRGAGFVRLTVEDDGPGMSEDVRGRVFDAFFTTKPLGKGTGLGLAVVQGLVEDMGGLISVDSEVGRGTRFDVLLPGAAAPSAAAEAEAAPPPLGTERLLIVDDETEIAATLRRVLERYGYRIEAFTSPKAALRSFRKAPDRFAALITDVVMPDMDGMELARRVRAVRRDLKVMFLTGYAPSAVDLAEPAPVMMRKPVDPEALGRALRQLLDGD